MRTGSSLISFGVMKLSTSTKLAGRTVLMRVAAVENRSASSAIRPCNGAMAFPRIGVPSAKTKSAPPFDADRLVIWPRTQRAAFPL